VTLLSISPETDALIGNLTLIAVSLFSLVVIARILWRTRGDRDRGEAAMIERVLAVLDTYEAEDPAFVAEARDLHGFLTPIAWITRVRTLAAQSSLSSQAQADLAAASPQFSVGATS
jgi:hypothetical protein